MKHAISQNPRSVPAMNGDSRILLLGSPFDARDNFALRDDLRAKEPLAPITRRYGGPLLLIRLAVVAIVPFVLVDAAMYQLQMFLAGGRTPITPAILKVGLLGTFTTAFLLRGRMSTPPATKIALAFVTYLILAGLCTSISISGSTQPRFCWAITRTICSTPGGPRARHARASH